MDKKQAEARLGQAQSITEGVYGDAVRAVIPLGNTLINGSNRLEYKVFLKSNSDEIDEEMYLNIFELSKEEKERRSKLAGNIDMDKKPVYEFVEKE